MKYLIAVVLFLGSHSSYTEPANCLYEGEYHEISADHPICIFNVGTEYWRTGGYSDAVLNWKKLVDIEVKEVGHEHIPATSNSNLGFAYYYGYGVHPDKDTGIKYWEKAASLGNNESQYWLCMVFGNPFSPHDYTPKVESYCNKAENYYKEIDESRLRSIRRIKKWILIRKIFTKD